MFGRDEKVSSIRLTAVQYIILIVFMILAYGLWRLQVMQSDFYAQLAEKNRIPYLGVAFALQKIHQQGFRYLFSPFWKSPDIGHATQGLLELIAAGERPKTVAIFQEKTDWGREMAAAWTDWHHWAP